MRPSSRSLRWKGRTYSTWPTEYDKIVYRHVGGSIRVGIGPTKTLAKVADENAKARKRAGWGEGTYVCPANPKLEELLRRVPVGDIWGIGSAYEEKLHEKGGAAAGLRALPDPWIRSEMTVVGLRTAWELRGGRV